MFFRNDTIESLREEIDKLKSKLTIQEQLINDEKINNDQAMASIGRMLQNLSNAINQLKTNNNLV